MKYNALCSSCSGQISLNNNLNINFRNIDDLNDYVKVLMAIHKTEQSSTSELQIMELLS